MGAVAALFAGIAVLILVAVVELEGNLGAVVQVGHADALDDALHLEIIVEGCLFASHCKSGSL